MLVSSKLQSRTHGQKMQDILATSEDGTIVFKQLTQKHLEDACQVMQKSHFTNGNVPKTIGLAEDPEALKELDQLLRQTAEDGVTVIAIDKDTDKLTGVAFNKILVKSEQFFESFRATFKNPRSRKMLEHLIILDEIYDFFEECQVECLMVHLFLGVLPEYRRKGIAKKLFELSVDIAQKLQNGVNVKKSLDGRELSLEPIPELVTSTLSSFISQRIGEQLGFEVVLERSIRRLEIHGEILENANVDTENMKLVYKKLTKS